MYSVDHTLFSETKNIGNYTHYIFFLIVPLRKEEDYEASVTHFTHTVFCNWSINALLY